MKPEWNCRILVLFSLTIFFVFSSYISFAQYTRGMVFDEVSKKPLPGVSVFITKTGIGTTTNENGEFRLKYPIEKNRNDTINFSSVGYSSKKMTFSDLKENGFIVLLSESVQLLDEVTIISDRKLKLQVAYTRLTPLKDGLYSFGSVLIGDKIYVIGGDESNEDGRGFKSISFVGNNLKMNSNFSWQSYTDKLQEYDIPSDKWTTSNLKFSKRAYHNINYYNGKIYVLGGKRLSRNRKSEYLDEKIEVHDISHNSIFIDKTNPHQAANFASFVYNDNLIVIGGSTKLDLNEEKDYTAKVHLLNLKSGYWYELADMPVAKETKGVLINNIIYLIGGYKMKPLEEIETCNLATAEWKTEGQLFYGVERPALAYNNNIIYIFEEGRIQTYNTVTRELNMFSIDLPLKSSELFYSNNMLYIVGGFVEYETSIKPSSDVYSIDLSEFNKTVIYDTKTF
ncbi:MAG: carboxypeptidase-like regulatory domain-containing protein [Bacteroidales bacterium]|nr:carboxypeptidase-like regulatory domain-containing protein [Bacteroidales bacterium]